MAKLPLAGFRTAQVPSRGFVVDFEEKIEPDHGDYSFCRENTRLATEPRKKFRQIKKRFLDRKVFF